MMATPDRFLLKPKEVVPSCQAGRASNNALDAKRHQRDEHGTQDDSGNRSHAADDDHRQIDDGELQRIVLDGDDPVK